MTDRRVGRRTHAWEHHNSESAALDAVRVEIMNRAVPHADDIAVDLGAGLAIPLAGIVGRVVAVSPSETLVSRLRNDIQNADLLNIVPIAEDFAQFAIPRQSVDLVVSNYVLHHLHHADKRAVVAKARRWLNPGGRLVIGDMMFGRGLSRGDGRILAAKSRSLAAKGPGGLWRIAKNLTKFGLHIGGTYPAPPQFWIKALEEAGFREVDHVQVVQEAGVVWGKI